MAKDCLIVCGGLPTPRRTSVETERHLSLHTPPNRIRLKITDLSEKLVSAVPDVLVDLIEIAAYVYTADQSVPRNNSADDYGDKWRRRFHFEIPVRRPRVWAGLRERLQGVLGFLSDDEYEFRFQKLSQPLPMETYLKFGTDPEAGQIEEVVMFSGGLDSLAGAVDEAVRDGRRVALVSHRAAPKVHGLQKRLVQAMAPRCEQRPLHIPIWIQKSKHLNRESTQRVRSFLYLSIGSTVARMLGLARVRIFENGITSVNLPVSDQLLGSRATRSTHPRILREIGELLGELTGGEFVIENPFFWKTKTDVISDLKKNACADLIEHTASCFHVWHAKKDVPHCGRCSQCLDRQFAARAAGCEEEDPSRRYKSDLFLSPRMDGPDRTAAESFIRSAQDLSEISADEFVRRFPEVHRAIPYTPGPEVRKRIWELYRRHAKQVNKVIADGIRQNADAIRRRIVPPNSILGMVLARPCDRAMGPPNFTDPLCRGSQPEDNVFRSENGVWCLQYAKRSTRLPHSKGLEVIARLLATPHVKLDAQDLVSKDGSRLVDGPGEELVDQRTMGEIRRRLKELEGEIEESIQDNDLGAQDQLVTEREQLLEFLAKVTTASGRSRRVPTATERARKSVSNAVARSLKNIQESHRTLAAHLRLSIKMGKHPRYRPDQEVVWKT